MSESLPLVSADFKPRRGAIITSGILFGLFGLSLCGIGTLMVL